MSGLSDSTLTPIGIDKGQSFKHLLKNPDSDDRALFKFLETNGTHYNPNANAESKMAYQKLWDDFKAGKDVNIVRPSESPKIQLMLQNVEDILRKGSAQNRKFVDTWTNYANEAFKAGKLPKGMTPDQFVETLMKRLDDLKANIAKQEELLIKSDAWKIKNGLELRAKTPEVKTLDPSLIQGEYKFRTEASLDATYKKEILALDPDTQAAGRDYSGSSSSSINSSLRTGTAVDRTTQERIISIDKGMARSVLKEDIRVVRNATAWTRADGAVVKLTDAVGKVIIHDNFVSTTVKKGGVFSGDKLEISVPKGTRAMWLKPVSQHVREEELLIDRGYRILITGQRKEGSVTIYEGVLLPDDVATTAIPKYVKKPVPQVKRTSY